MGRMSSSAAASSYWRVAGMSYLKYANLCADMVRSSLKEPNKSKAKLREAVYYRASTWKDGKPEKQGRRPHQFACPEQVKLAAQLSRHVKRF